MIKVNEIKGRMVAEGYTMEDIAKALGITSKTLNGRFKKGVMRTDEVEVLIKMLNIENPMEIFLPNKLTNR